LQKNNKIEYILGKNPHQTVFKRKVWWGFLLFMGENGIKIFLIF